MIQIKALDSTTQDSKDPSTMHENSSPTVNGDQLKAMSLSMLSPGSLLDGMSNIDAEAVREKVFKNVFGYIAQLADYLGYSWIGGRTLQNDIRGYVYVRTDNTMDTPEQRGEDNAGYEHITGPGFVPDMAGSFDGYREGDRTTFQFPENWLSFSEVQYGTPQELNERKDSLISFTIDNDAGSSSTTTSVTLNYFSQGQVQSSVGTNWSKNDHWDISSTQTVNLGEPAQMYPSATLSMTESGGGSSTSGGDASTSKSFQASVGETLTHTITTPAHTSSEYALQATTYDVFIPFKATATLNFSVFFHGFMKWGGGNRFQGGTNYSNEASGSGDRPTLDWRVGSKTETFFTALAREITDSSGTWNWAACENTYPALKGFLSTLTSQAFIDQHCTFPVTGALAGVSRREVAFVTVKETPAG